MSATTKIEILVAPGCASRQQTEDLVAKLLAESAIKANAEVIMVSDAEQAAATRFLGSPSVRINGIDVEPEARERKEYGMG
jgi:hypothetical protein